MKSRIAPLLIALLSLGALLAAGCKPAQEPVPPPAQKTDSREPGQSPAQKTVGGERIEVSEYGTLKRLRSADGKNFPAAAGETLGDGYAIGYQYKEPEKAKPVERLIYALGDEHSDNLEVVREAQAPAGGNSVQAVVKTKDQALKVTHRFRLDENGGVLEVWRTIQCLAPQGVQLFVVKLQAGSLLSGGAQSAVRSRLEDLASGVIGAGFYSPKSECGPKCPPGWPCLSGPSAAICDPPPVCWTPPQCHPVQGRPLPAGIVVQTPDKARTEFNTSLVSRSAPLASISGGAYAATSYWKLRERREDNQLKQNEEATIVVRHKKPR